MMTATTTRTHLADGLLNGPGSPCFCPTCGPATFTPAGLIVDGARPAAALAAGITTRDGLDWLDARLAMKTVADEECAELRTWWLEHRRRLWSGLGLVRAGVRA